MADFAPQLIKGYELHEMLGEGGFGAVYRAFQPLVKREVAIKVILPLYANQPDFVRRFEMEAQVVAQLEHLHIVPLYDFWRDPSGAYLVMRMLRGGSLDESLRTKGAWDVDSAIRLAEQISSALSLAHQNGIVHGDLKPANILLDTTQNAYLSDFGIASGLKTQDADAEREIAGTPAYIAPEQIQKGDLTPATDIYSLGLVMFEVLTGQPAFQSESFSGYVLKHLSQMTPDLRQINPELPAAFNEVIRTATAKRPQERYSDVMDFARAFTAAAHQQDSAKTIAANQDFERLITVPADLGNFVLTPEMLDMEAATSEIPNPYKGLRAFQQRDAKDFFGRQALTEQIIGRLQETEGHYRALAVIGPSGSGKSSVVKAGVIPALRQGALPGSEHAFIVEMVPGADAMRELESALLSVAVNGHETLSDDLRSGPEGLHNSLMKILPADGSEFFLIIDQFEEVFTQTEDHAVRTRFMDSLRYAIDAPDSRLRVILTLRADFYDKPLLYPEFGAIVRERTEVVLPLSQAELAETIVGPAERVGVRVAQDLVQTIVTEVKDEPGALPLLQYALTENFERRVGLVMTLENYRESGGVLGSLARRAEELFGQMNTEQQEATRQLFLRLVTLGEGTEDTRRRILWSELVFSRDTDDPLQYVLDTFGRYRLLTFDKDPQTREPTVEVAHEALIRQWERMRQWLQNSREDLRTQRRLSSALTEWRNSGRDSSFLASGVRLQQFESLAENTDIALSREELEYVQASVAERKRQESLEEQRRQQELILERQAANRLRALIGVMAIFLIVAVGLGLYAFGQQRIAEAAHQEAVDSLNKSETLRLAVEGNNLMQIGSNAEVAALLAIRSVNKQYTDQGYNALLRAANFEYATNVISGHTGPIVRVRYTPDGKYLLTASIDKTARLWDVKTGKQVQQFVGSGDEVWDAVYAPNGQFVVTSSLDRTTRVWDVATGKELYKVVNGGSRVWGIAISADSRYLVTGFGSGAISMWDLQTKQVVQKFTGHTDYVVAIEFSPDGKTLLTGSGDATARLWDVATGKLLQTFTGHTNVVQGIDFSPDGKTIVTSSWDKTIRLWDIKTGAQIRQFLGDTDQVYNVQFTPDGKYILSASEDKTARLWNAATGEEVQRFANDTLGIETAALSADGTQAVTAGNDGLIRVWNVHVGYAPLRFLGAQGATLAVAMSHNGKYVLTGGTDRIARLYDAQTGKVVREYSDHVKTNGGILSVAFSPDDKFILAAGDDRRVMLWNVESGELLQIFVQDPSVWDWMDQVSFSPDGKYILTSSKDKSARIYDAQTYQQKISFSLPAGIYGAAFSPDGKTIVTGADDGTLILWDVATGQQIKHFVGHKGLVFRVAFSPDGKLLLSGSEDTTVKLWDVATAKELHSFSNHKDDPDVAFSPDGRYILTGNHDGGGATLWDAQTYDAIQTAYMGGPIRSVAFSPDGKFMLLGSNDTTAALLYTSYRDQELALCSLVHRDLTPDERSQYIITETDATCPQFGALANPIPPTATAFTPGQAAPNIVWSFPAQTATSNATPTPISTAAATTVATTAATSAATTAATAQPTTVAASATTLPTNTTAPTATPVPPTNTAVPTNTALPTSTTAPTATSIPPTELPTVMPTAADF